MAVAVASDVHIDFDVKSDTQSSHVRYDTKKARQLLFALVLDAYLSGDIKREANKDMKQAGKIEAYVLVDAKRGCSVPFSIQGIWSIKPIHIDVLNGSFDEKTMLDLRFEVRQEDGFQWWREFDDYVDVNDDDNLPRDVPGSPETYIASPNGFIYPVRTQYHQYYDADYHKYYGEEMVPTTPMHMCVYMNLSVVCVDASGTMASTIQRRTHVIHTTPFVCQ